MVSPKATHRPMSSRKRVAISRFGTMFFTDPVAAFANIASAIRPGGRLAFLCWQKMARNEHVALPLRVAAAYSHFQLPPGGDCPGPYSLADPARTKKLLTSAGFDRVRIEPVEELLRVGRDADDVLRYYQAQPLAKPFMATARKDQVVRVREAIRTALVAHESSGGVFLASAAWLVTARRPEPPCPER